MPSSPPQQRPGAPRHPATAASNDDANRSWSRRLWLFLGALGIVSAGLIVYFDQPKETVDEAYVPLQVKTTVGAGRMAIGKLSLLIAPDQEEGIRDRRQLLEAVIGQSLADSYQDRLRPKLSEVRENLHAAINGRLPSKLKVRDVLIQELLLGSD